MEGFDISYDGKNVGKIAVQHISGGVRFDAVCTLSGETVLRLYGELDGKFLPIGVLVPHGGYWHIARTLTQQTLQDAGFADVLPQRYLLSDKPPQASETGDRLIDDALRNKTVHLLRTADGYEVSCPFDPSMPSPLAFALTACNITDARAVLKIKQADRTSGVSAET